MSLNAVDIRHVWLCFLYSYIPSHSSFLRLPLETLTPADWLVWCLSVCDNVRVCVACMCARVEWCSVSSMWCEYWPRPVLCSDWLLSLSCHLSLSLLHSLSSCLPFCSFHSGSLHGWSPHALIDQCFVTFLVTAFSVPTSVKQANML